VGGEQTLSQEVGPWQEAQIDQDLCGRDVLHDASTASVEADTLALSGCTLAILNRFCTCHDDFVEAGPYAMHRLMRHPNGLA